MLHQLLAGLYRQGVGSTACAKRNFIWNEDSRRSPQVENRSRRHESSYETTILEMTQAVRVATAPGSDCKRMCHYGTGHIRNAEYYYR